MKTGCAPDDEALQTATHRQGLRVIIAMSHHRSGHDNLKKLQFAEQMAFYQTGNPISNSRGYI